MVDILDTVTDKRNQHSLENAMVGFVFPLDTCELLGCIWFTNFCSQPIRYFCLHSRPNHSKNYRLPVGWISKHLLTIPCKALQLLFQHYFPCVNDPPADAGYQHLFSSGFPGKAVSPIKNWGPICMCILRVYSLSFLCCNIIIWLAICFILTGKHSGKLSFWRTSWKKVQMGSGTRFSLEFVSQLMLLFFSCSFSVLFYLILFPLLK